jgi:hypothetical protein
LKKQWFLTSHSFLASYYRLWWCACNLLLFFTSQIIVQCIQHAFPVLFAFWLYLCSIVLHLSLSLLSTQSVIDEVLLANLCHWIFLKSKCWYINRELLMSSLLYMLSQVLGFNLKGCSSISQVLDLLSRDHQFECNMLQNNINYILGSRLIA